MVQDTGHPELVSAGGGSDDAGVPASQDAQGPHLVLTTEMPEASQTKSQPAPMSPRTANAPLSMSQADSQPDSQDTLAAGIGNFASLSQDTLKAPSDSADQPDPSDPDEDCDIQGQGDSLADEGDREPREVRRDVMPSPGWTVTSTPGHSRCFVDDLETISLPRWDAGASAESAEPGANADDAIPLSQASHHSQASCATGAGLDSHIIRFDQFSPGEYLGTRQFINHLATLVIDSMPSNSRKKLLNRCVAGSHPNESWTTLFSGADHIVDIGSALITQAGLHRDFVGGDTIQVEHELACELNDIVRDSIVKRAEEPKAKMVMKDHCFALPAQHAVFCGGLQALLESVSSCIHN